MIRKMTEGFTPKQYLKQLLCGCVALFGFYLIIAWSSYSPFDSAWSVNSYQGDTINKAGALGAWLVDLFFVFLGDIGNLFPFIFCAVPIYMLWTKSITELTWTRFALRLFGLVLLCCGLTILCTLLLSNSAYHLSGGVLGGSLTHHFLPILDKFGVLLCAVILTVVGFIFCSGASFIRLMVAFYNWLTVKNEDLPTYQEQPSTENLADIEDETALASAEYVFNGEEDISVETTFNEEEQLELTEHSVSPSINIMGLNQPTDDVFEPTQFGNYDVEPDELPEVKISLDDQPISTPTIPTTPLWQATVVDTPSQQSHPEFLDPRQSSVVIPEPDVSETTVSMPQVTLTPPTLVQPVEPQQESMIPNPSASSFEPMDDMVEMPETNEQSGLRTLSVDEVVQLFGDHKATTIKPNTDLPSIDLLDKRDVKAQDITPEEIQATSQRIEQQLNNFNVKASVKDVLVGPVVTRYELELQPGVKASKVTNIETDLARALMFRSIRVAESIPDKPYIGIETPNAHRQIVPLRDVLESDEFRHSNAILPMALGKDISGKAVVIDLAKTPHLLVAGSTGSGKSVGINTMILSLLFRVKPEEVKFIMIDPKVVELSVYNDIPHLLTEVVTDMKKAANALRWCVDEMERRYQLLSKLRVRNIEGFNERIDAYRADNIVIPDPLWKPGDSMDTTAPILQKLSYIVVIVDEFADLMMVAGKQIEELIARLTQKARAVGIHVILATQRPSVDVITGLIKSNIPSRIAFTVVQRNDSRTILDQNGAETLLGRGDMLYLGNGTTDLVRVHGAFMSDEEVNRVADEWRARGKPEYVSAILESSEDDNADDDSYGGEGSDELDPLFDEVMEFVIRTGTTSASSIQRRFRVGFNRAARIMDQLEEQGIVSEMRNGKREILARNTEY